MIFIINIMQIVFVLYLLTDCRRRSDRRLSNLRLLSNLAACLTWRSARS